MQIVSVLLQNICDISCSAVLTTLISSQLDCSQRHIQWDKCLRRLLVLYLCADGLIDSDKSCFNFVPNICISQPKTRGKQDSVILSLKDVLRNIIYFFFLGCVLYCERLHIDSVLCKSKIWKTCQNEILYVIIVKFYFWGYVKIQYWICRVSGQRRVSSHYDFKTKTIS